jgi:uncharacterized protein (UPF0335 family)
MIDPISEEILKREFKALRDRIEALERERDHYEKAIKDCLEMAASRYWEWGDRAIRAIEILENALDQSRK